MLWQDPVLMVCGIGLSLSLLPTLKAKKYPSRLACLLTGGILVIVSFTQLTLGLYLSGIMSALTSGIWWYMFTRGGTKWN